MAYLDSPPPYPGLAIGIHGAVTPSAPTLQAAASIPLVDDPRPWECQYCGLKCTRGEGEERHWHACPKFPEPCPNSCEVGSVERCNMKQHRSACSLEPVACEMKEFGCSVVVLRKELARHMRESELQHLTAMTMLNLRLTTLLQQESTERDKKIENLQHEITQIKFNTNHIGQHMGALCSGSSVLTFSQYSKTRHCTKLTVLSDPFYSHHRGYKFQLRLCYEPAYIAAWLYLAFGEYDEYLIWPVDVSVHFELLNQVEDHSHI